MIRKFLALLVLTTSAMVAKAHFVYIVPAKDGKTVQVVFSDSLEPDQAVSIEKVAGLKLVGRFEGKEHPIVLQAGKHSLSGTIEGKPNMAFGSVTYGLMTRGDNPSLLKYHPKIVFTGCNEKTDTIGESVPVELVPVVVNGTARFQVLASGKPLAEAEVNVLKPDGKKEKLQTDAKGWTTKVEGTGRYAAWAKRSETTAGEHDGKKYTEIRHYATLVVDVKDVAVEPKTIPDLPDAFSSFGAATVDGYVYVYGGHAGKTHSYASETTLGKFRRMKVDEPTKGWEELPASTHLQGLALVGYKHALIRVGGMEPRNAKAEKADNNSVATVQKYDPSEKKWTNLAELPAGRSSHDAVVVGDTLVVVGGWNMKGVAGKNEWHNNALTLDLTNAKSTWKSIEQPFSRRALTAAEQDGKVLVFGGLTSDNKMDHSVNILDLKTGKWTTGPRIPGDRMNAFTPASCTIDGKVYLNPADGKIYRMSGEKWEELSAVKTPRWVHRMVPFGDNNMLVLCGATGSGSVASCELASTK